MTYTYECDGFCDKESVQGQPALTGEFSEQWFRTTVYGDYLKEQGYTPGDLVTLCGGCLNKLLIEYE